METMIIIGVWRRASLSEEGLRTCRLVRWVGGQIELDACLGLDVEPWY